MTRPFNLFKDGIVIFAFEGRLDNPEICNSASIGEIVDSIFDGDGSHPTFDEIEESIMALVGEGILIENDNDTFELDSSWVKTRKRPK